MSNKIREFTIRMDDEHAKELARMSEAAGEDNELVYLERLAICAIEIRVFQRKMDVLLDVWK